MVRELQYIFSRFAPLLLFLPFLIAIGKVAPPLAAVVFLVFLVVAGANQQHHLTVNIIILMFLLGDSRHMIFDFCKNLRTVGILYLLVFTLKDIFSGRYPFRRVYLNIIPFAIASFISLTQSPVIDKSLPRYISYLLLFFVVIHYFDYLVKTQAKKFIKDLISFVILVEIIGVMGIFLFPSIVWYNGGNRFNGILGNPNSVGVYTAINFIIMYLYFFKYNPSESRSVKIMYISFIVIPVMISGSRNGLITIMIFFALLFLANVNVVLKIVYISIVSPVVIFLSDPENLTRILTQLGLAEKLRANTLKDGGGRFLAWAKAVENVQISPLFGRGFYYQEHLFRQLYPVLSKLGHEGDVHNSYLAFLLNFGFVGTALVLLFIFSLIRRFEDKKYILPVAGAIGFNAFFEPWLTSSLSPFMVYFLLLVVILMRHNTVMAQFQEPDAALQS